MSLIRGSIILAIALALIPTTRPALAQQPGVRLEAARPPSADAAPAITISFDDTPVGAVISSFADFAEFSFVLGRGVGGTISADIREVPWDVALDAVLNAYGMRMVETEGGINRVESFDEARRIVEYVEPETRVFKVRFHEAAEFLDVFQAVLTERGSIAVSEATNSIVVTDIPEILDRIERMLWG